MRIAIEMENGKKYNIQYKEDLATFVQQVQFVQGNLFFLTEEGKYISINKIVEFKPEG